jgi:hypothetical protein
LPDERGRSPPGIGLTGTPLGVFSAGAGTPAVDRGARDLTLLGAITCTVYQHPAPRREHAGGAAGGVRAAVAAQFAVRTARLAVTRDGVRWG